MILISEGMFFFVFLRFLLSIMWYFASRSLILEAHQESNLPRAVEVPCTCGPKTLEVFYYFRCFFWKQFLNAPTFEKATHFLDHPNPHIYIQIDGCYQVTLMCHWCYLWSWTMICGECPLKYHHISLANAGWLKLVIDEVMMTSSAKLEKQIVHPFSGRSHPCYQWIGFQSLTHLE